MGPEDTFRRSMGVWHKSPRIIRQQLEAIRFTWSRAPTTRRLEMLYLLHAYGSVGDFHLPDYVPGEVNVDASHSRMRSFHSSGAAHKANIPFLLCLMKHNAHPVPSGDHIGTQSHCLSSFIFLIALHTLASQYKLLPVDR